MKRLASAALVFLLMFSVALAYSVKISGHGIELIVTSEAGNEIELEKIDEGVVGWEVKSGNVTITKENKEIAGAEVLSTGDIITIKTENESKTFRIIITGDANGDGKISAVDYVKIKNYIMNSSSLDGAYKIAADANNDGKISAVDYVNVKNYIMGKNSTLR